MIRRALYIMTAAMILAAIPASSDVIIVKIAPTDVGDYALDDGYVYGRNTNGIWVSACNTGYASNATFGTIIIGNRNYDVPNPAHFYRWKGLLRFNLEPYQGDINSIKLYIWVWRKRGVGPWTPITVFKTATDWYPASSGDFQMSAPWALGSRATGDFTVGAYNSFVLNKTPLSLGEWLPLRLEDEDLNCFVPPAPGHWDTFEFYSRDLGGQADTTKAPFLEIDYTPDVAGPSGIIHRGAIHDSEVMGSEQLKVEER